MGTEPEKLRNDIIKVFVKHGINKGFGFCCYPDSSGTNFVAVGLTKEHVRAIMKEVIGRPMEIIETIFEGSNILDRDDAK